MKKLIDYIDSYGVIGQRKQVTPGPEHPDGIWIETGDGLQRRGMMLIAQDPLIYGYTTDHEPTPGIFRRGADLRYWYSDPRNCSRDQMTSYIIGCGLHGQTDVVLRSLWANIKRFGFYQNRQRNWEPNWQDPPSLWAKGKKTPDIMSPEYLCAYLRAIIYPQPIVKFITLYSLFFPILLLGDFLGIFATLFKVIKSHINHGFSDDLTRMCLLVQASHLPTPLSFISVWLYKHRYGGPQYALDTYFGSIESPPINEIWKPVVKEVWG